MDTSDIKYQLSETTELAQQLARERALIDVVKLLIDRSETRAAKLVLDMMER